jgi:peroxiredoxin
MSLQATIDAFQADLKAGKLPIKLSPEVFATMARATAELVASGLADRALKVGDTAPAFTLNDPEGVAVSSARLLTEGPLIVSFYRGVWCPYCNMELQALEAALPALRAAGAHLVAISPQTAANSRKSLRENRLSFPVLCDPRNALAAKFGVRHALPDYLADLYKKQFANDLAVVNEDDSWTLPMPARFVIGQDGVILYAEVNPDYTRRPEPEELLPVLGQARVAIA